MGCDEVALDRWLGVIQRNLRASAESPRRSAAACRGSVTSTTYTRPHPHRGVDTAGRSFVRRCAFPCGTIAGELSGFPIVALMDYFTDAHGGRFARVIRGRQVGWRVLNDGADLGFHCVLSLTPRAHRLPASETPGRRRSDRRRWPFRSSTTTLRLPLPSV